jgi:hypothetical protein
MEAAAVEEASRRRRRMVETRALKTSKTSARGRPRRRTAREERAIILTKHLILWRKVEAAEWRLTGCSEVALVAAASSTGFLAFEAAPLC